MKQLLKVLALVLVLVLAVGVLVACNEDKPTTDPNNNNNNNNNTNNNTDDEDEGDEDAEYAVTFMYVDPEGNPMPDVGGYTSKVHGRIEWNKNARNTNTGSVTAFTDYVIIGWNTDLEKAMAGEVDDACIKNIKKDKTVYSVVREKELKTVTFLKSDGKVDSVVEMLEGSKVDSSIKRPSEMGRYFKEWQFVQKDDDNAHQSTINCIYGDCTFKAVMGATDGTIGKVGKDAIELDAKKDPAYEASGAYLAHNTAKMANDALDTAHSGSYMVPTVKADTWMVWDGDYIYLLIEVYDKSLTFRSDAYVKSGADAWCNDAVELWYNFEQDSTLTKNSTRVGLSALGDIKTPGDGKYALPRSIYNGNPTGIGGGRSTHYDDIEYAVRNAYFSDDKSGLAADGKDLPSYIIEFKIPAWTEGEADLNYAYKDWNAATPTEKLTGLELEDFKATGRLYGVAADNDNIENYRFTSGTQLQGGDFVRFCLQINDLKISFDDLNPLRYLYLDTPDLATAKDFVKHHGAAWDETFAFDSTIMLYEFDKTTNKLKGASTYDKFSATGSTQYNISMYLMFSLSDTAEADTKVWGFRGDLANPKNQILLTKVWDEANEEWKEVVYTRPEIAG